jgi:pyruvate dehydrogenase E1 component
MAAERHNMLHPTDSAPQVSYVGQCLNDRAGPVIAATDYMRTYADNIRPYIKKTYKVLGTDGFGRSDSRENLRRFFEVNRYFVVIAALKALAEDREVPISVVADAIKKYNVDVTRPDPWMV